jgi:hypothetical protein
MSRLANAATCQVDFQPGPGMMPISPNLPFVSVPARFPKLQKI